MLARPLNEMEGSKDSDIVFETGEIVAVVLPESSVVEGIS